MSEEVDINTVTNITELLTLYQEINNVRKLYDEKENIIKNKLRIFLKEKGWSNYKDDETDISFNISKVEKEELDKTQLRLFINEEQYKQCLKIKTFERLNIITPELRKRMKNFIKNPIKGNLLK